MNRIQMGSRACSQIAALALLLCSFQPADTTAAQAQANPSLVLSTNPADAADPLAKLILRPNVEQPVFLFVKNPGEEARKLTVVVQTADKAELTRAAVTAPPGKTQRVTFAKPAPPADKKPAPAPAPPVDPKAPPAEAKKPDWPALQGPPFTLNFLLYDDKNKLIETRTEPIVLLAPSQYLEAGATYGGGKLTVTVTPLPTFTGPPCPVDLIVRPDGLQPANGKEPAGKDGNLHEMIQRPGQAKKLVALLAAADLGRTGTVYLSVDGMQRSFIFPAEFHRRATATAFDLLKEPGLRVVHGGPAPKGGYRLLTVPVPRYPLRLETDNLPLDTRVEIGVDRDLDGNYDEAETVVLPGSRQRKVFYDPEMPDGGLLFRTEVTDWVYELDTAGLVGEHAVRVRLGGGASPDLAQEGVVVFDTTPPENIDFLAFPRKVVKGKPLNVQATAADPESGVVKAEFFLAATKDGKLPADATPLPALPPAAGGSAWAAALPLPADKKVVDITVRFTNGAGVSDTKSAKVELVDPPPSGTIKGKVLEGNRPQAGLNVALTDEKGATAIDAKKSNDKGEFLFENVKPGTYKVASTKPESKTEGAEVVGVEVDKTSDVTINLTRKPAPKK